MTIRAIAWDIDGTLVDSEPLHHEALRRVSARYGVTVPPVDPQYVGVAMDAVWEYFRAGYPDDLTMEAWLDEILVAYLDLSADLKAFPQSLPTMRRLAEAGIRQCCVSNSIRRIVDANVVATGIDRLVEFTISRDDVVSGKPDPEPYRAACVRFGLDPSQVMAVEDSRTGLASASAAGLACLHIGTDIRDVSEVLARIGLG